VLGDSIADQPVLARAPSAAAATTAVWTAAVAERDQPIASEAMHARVARTSSGFSFMLVAGDHSI
jgi:hypothetical protein